MTQPANDAQASEGEITEGSPAWESVPAGDRPRRKRAAADKALKLRSPNFAVSTTRLSVRNIPASMSDKTLKQLALQAVIVCYWACQLPCCSRHVYVLMAWMQSASLLS